MKGWKCSSRGWQGLEAQRHAAQLFTPQQGSCKQICKPTSCVPFPPLLACLQLDQSDQSFLDEEQVGREGQGGDGQRSGLRQRGQD